jgi:hypothetical protein
MPLHDPNTPLKVFVHPLLFFPFSRFCMLFSVVAQRIHLPAEPDGHPLTVGNLHKLDSTNLCKYYILSFFFGLLIVCLWALFKYNNNNNNNNNKSRFHLNRSLIAIRPTRVHRCVIACKKNGSLSPLKKRTNMRSRWLSAEKVPAVLYGGVWNFR